MRIWNKCPKCLTTIEGGTDFCPNCGEPWTIRCQYCDLTWRFWEDRKFCPDCGTKVEKPGVSKFSHSHALP